MIMLQILVFITTLSSNQHVRQIDLPSVQKFGYAQTMNQLVLLTYVDGGKGKAAIIDLTTGTTFQIDHQKLNFMFPIAMKLQGKFTLLDTIVKKTCMVDDKGELLQSKSLLQATPQLGKVRIVAASVINEQSWLFTLADKDRDVFVVARYTPSTGALDSWFEEMEVKTPRTWSWINGQLVRVSNWSGEIVTVNTKTGQKIKTLQPARPVVMPKKKKKWMRELQPYSQLGQFVNGAMPTIVALPAHDDGSDQDAQTSLTFSGPNLIDTPYAVLGDYKGKRLLFHWETSELLFEEK